MSNILYNTIEPATEYSARIQSNLQPDMPYILASEVMAEFEKRTGSGQQYTTFPNRISDAEKAKLTAAGYKVTENTIVSKNLGGAPDMYIGFQVALNETASAEDYAMVISQEEKNGIEGGGGSSFTPTQAQLDAMNSGITSDGVSQIGTNSTKLQGIKSTTDESITMNNDDTLVISTGTPSGTIPENAIGVSF